MGAIVLTADQRRVLASDEFEGPVQVCSLGGLPDRESPIVVHDADTTSVIDEDGALFRRAFAEIAELAGEARL